MNRVFLFIVALSACVPVSQSSNNSASGGQKRLQLVDAVYENNIKTARVFSDNQSSLDQLLPAVTQIGKWNLILEFDDLHTDRDNYYIRIIHCNQNWTKSTLMDLDYLTDYNEFPINNFEFSLDTWIPYVHYWAKLPAVKLPGNYLAVVYRNSDKEDIILSKRFMVYEPRVSFLRDGKMISSGAVAVQNQQLNFTVNYKNLTLLNPMEMVNVTIRQNQRWDNLAQEVKPSFVKENIQELEYRFFGDSDMFKGGNEFRFFDLRSINYPGRNVSHMDKSKVPWTAYIEKDKSKAGEYYSQYQDYNGGYLLDNYDYRITNASNYANVVFTLSSAPVQGEVFLMGAFNQWSASESNRMKYDSTKREYSASFLLRQGWYDYQYAVKSKTLPYFYLEGSHFQTENKYEIFVYYRSFQPNADLLIGYLAFAENPKF